MSVYHNYGVCPMILLLVLVCKWIWFPFVGGNDCRSETVHCRAACPGWAKVSTGLLTLIKKLLTANSCYKIQKLPIQDGISHRRRILGSLVKCSPALSWHFFFFFCETCNFMHELITQFMCFFYRLGGLESKVDIVVATPGRLVDHINKTPGFSLTDLRFLVCGQKWDETSLILMKNLKK